MSFTDNTQDIANQMSAISGMLAMDDVNEEPGCLGFMASQWIVAAGLKRHQMVNKLCLGSQSQEVTVRA